MHLRLQGFSQGAAANRKAAKGSLVLFLFFHPVVRVKFLGVIAHLLHAFKALLAFVAHVQFLLVGNLLMLHEFFHFAKFSSAFLAFMFFKHS
jgi:hypothetical protein